MSAYHTLELEKRNGNAHEKLEWGGIPRVQSEVSVRLVDGESI